MIGLSKALDDPVRAGIGEHRIQAARDLAKLMAPERVRAVARRLILHRARIQKARGIRRAYEYDRDRYVRYSSSFGSRGSRKNLAARITAVYHNIEKGLALPTPRAAFGATTITDLLDLLQSYRSRYGDDRITHAAIAALAAYNEFNRAEGLSPEDIPSFERSAELVASAQPNLRSGGTKRMQREAVDRVVRGVSAEFFSVRSSVRQFGSEGVSTDDIEFAVRAAQKSPAVCNRQYSRAYVATDPERVQQALALQGGARGFAEGVPAVAVITTSLRTFWGTGERMQPWTDGGMFAMSFVLGLHARGLGTVCLNWSKDEMLDREFHRAFDLPDDEVIIMLVGFGPLLERFEVAASPRVPVREALRSL